MSKSYRYQHSMLCEPWTQSGQSMYDKLCRSEGMNRRFIHTLTWTRGENDLECTWFRYRRIVSVTRCWRVSEVRVRRSLRYIPLSHRMRNRWFKACSFMS